MGQEQAGGDLPVCVLGCQLCDGSLALRQLFQPQRCGERRWGVRSRDRRARAQLSCAVVPSAASRLPTPTTGPSGKADGAGAGALHRGPNGRSVLMVEHPGGSRVADQEVLADEQEGTACPTAGTEERLLQRVVADGPGCRGAAARSVATLADEDVQQRGRSVDRHRSVRIPMCCRCCGRRCRRTPAPRVLRWHRDHRWRPRSRRWPPDDGSPPSFVGEHVYTVPELAFESVSTSGMAACSRPHPPSTTPVDGSARSWTSRTAITSGPYERRRRAGIPEDPSSGGPGAPPCALQWLQVDLDLATERGETTPRCAVGGPRFAKVGPG